MKPHLPRQAIEPLEPRLLMAVIAVQNNHDSGPGSLRQAIADAVGGDTIDLSSREGTLITFAAPIVIDKDLTLVGSALQVLLTGNHGSRLFEVAAGTTVAMSDMVLMRGGGGGGAIYNAGHLSLTRMFFNENIAMRLGGAIYNDQGTLEIVDSTFTANVANGSGAAVVAGGAIYSVRGTLSVYGSIFSDNLADGGTIAPDESRVAYGGAIMVEEGSVALTNSTFSGNVSRGGSSPEGLGSSGNGGAVGLATQAVASIIHCTFAYNRAIGGNGASSIFDGQSRGSAISGHFAEPISLTNNLFAGTPVSDDSLVDGISTSISSGGGNVFDQTPSMPGVTIGANGDRVEFVQLDYLDYSGGYTMTHRPVNSWSVHEGIAAPGLPDLDQRRLPRTGTPHAGAVQWQPPQAGYTRAVRLNGDADFIRIPDLQHLLQQQRFSVQVNVKLAAEPADYNPLYSYGQAGASESVLLAFRADTEQLLVRLRRTDGTDLVNYAVSVPRERMAGQWVTVGMLWVGTEASLYLDGEWVGESEDKPLETIGYGAADQGWIGSAFGQQSLIGDIDEVIVTNAAVSPFQMLYREWEYERVPEWVAGYWTFDESRIPYTMDEGPNKLYAEVRGERIDSTMPVRVFLREDHSNFGLHFLPGFAEQNGSWLEPEIVAQGAKGNATIQWQDGGFASQYLPQFDAYGADSFTYRITDGTWNSTATVLVTIRPEQDWPLFVTTTLPTAVLGMPYNQTIQAADPDGGAITIAAAMLPSWLTLADNGDGTATLWGTPTDPSATSYPIIVRANDGDWYSPEASFTLNVYVPPTFTSTPPTTAFFDTTYRYTIQTIGGEGRTITATGLPSWLTLVDHGDGTATLSGMPVDSLASSHPITLRVGDGEHVTEQPFVLSAPMEPFRMDDKGTVIVIGTVGRDAIQVWVRENQVRAVRNGVIRNFPLSTVTALSVYGLDEDDVISVNMRWIPAYVLGGGGNDRVYGGDERDFFIGGSGHDRLHGGAGDDRLSGLGGNDYLEGGSGRDHLTGGDGHDVLVGNAGNDRLYGDAGNDTLYGKDRLYDILHGGDGDDEATYDPNDLLHGPFVTAA